MSGSKFGDGDKELRTKLQALDGNIPQSFKGFCCFLEWNSVVTLERHCFTGEMLEAKQH